jgi:GNAT superfamily N-acetyltransferase
VSQTVPENSAAQMEAASETAKLARDATYQLSPEDATLADVGVPVTPLPDHPDDFLISLAADERDIGRCYGVMAQLRPHLNEGEFIERVTRQEKDGYLLVYGEVNGEVVAVAGFRVLENLAWGRFLYVDDLVTAQAERSKGHGDALMNWLLDYARASGCAQFHLDSGVQRHDAHRFYFRQRMNISGYHFALEL